MKIRNRHTRPVANQAMVVNPFVSEAQRATMLNAFCPGKGAKDNSCSSQGGSSDNRVSEEEVVALVRESPNLKDHPKFDSPGAWDRYAGRFGIEGTFVKGEASVSKLKENINSGHLRMSGTVTKEGVAEKVASGKLNTIIITHEPGRQMLVVDGNHSLEAAIKRGDDKVKVIVADKFKSLIASALTVNLFVSEAQRAACYAQNDPSWDCNEWEEHTPKAKLPARKKHPTVNERRKLAKRAKAKRRYIINKNPLKLDPTRTIGLRNKFVKDLKRRFALLKGAIYRLIVDEDVFGLKPRAKNPLLSNAFCPTGEGGGVDPSCSASDTAAQSIEALGTRYAEYDGGDIVASSKLFSEFRGAVDRYMVGVAARYGLQVLRETAGTGSYYIELNKLDENEDVLATAKVRIATHKAAYSNDWSFQPSDSAKSIKLGLDTIEKVFQQTTNQLAANRDQTEIAINVFCPTGEGGGVDPSCSASEGENKGLKSSGAPTAIRKLKPGEVVQVDVLPNGKEIVHTSPNSNSYAVVDENGIPIPAYHPVTGKQYGHEIYPSKKAAENVLAFLKNKLTGNSLAANTRWKFHTTSEQVAAFQEWLKRQLIAKVIGAKEDELWRKYIGEGFRKGAGRAFDDVNKPYATGYAKDQSTADFYQGGKKEFLRSSFGQPESVDKVKLLAGRTFDDLENVTSDMSAKISRHLTDGLVQGQNPREIAKAMAEDVDISQTRALAIARTEIVRAHAEGQLTALENLGVEEVGVTVEWLVTDDEKLCPLCEALEGIVLKVSEAHGLLPRHPNCRCSFTPAGVGEDDKDQKDTKRQIDKAIAESVELDGGDKKTTWLGADVEIDKKRPESILNQSLTDAFNDWFDEHAWKVGGYEGDPFAYFVNNVFCATGEGGGVDPSCSPSGGVKLEGVKVAVVTETNLDDADVLLSQGIRPDFKRQRVVEEYAPGAGLERGGAYVAREGAFSKGSFGNVRVHMEVDRGYLDVPQEMKQLGYERDKDAVGQKGLDYVLGTENGGVTRGEIDRSAITKVEVYESGKWRGMTASEYRAERGIESVPRLPSGSQYEKTLREKAGELHLQERHIQQSITDYNRAKVADKVFLAQDIGLVENVFCPTGEGGGVDATCSPGESSKFSNLSISTRIDTDWGTPQFLFHTKDGKEVGELQLKLRKRGSKDMVTANLLVWPEFQRKGYATEFYRYAAEWVENRGGKLYISQNRTKDALALHKSFEKKGFLAKDGRIHFPAN